MNLTLDSQMKKYYFLGFLLIILVSTISFAFISSVVYKNQTKEFSQEILKLNITLLDNKLLEIQENQKIIVNDSRIREIIKYRKENKKLDYSIELYNQRTVMEKFRLLLTNLKIDNAYIVTREGDVYYSFRTSFREEGLKDKQWFKEIKNIAVLGISYISRVHSNDYILTNNSKKYISIIMPFSKFDSLPNEYLVYDITLENIFYSEIYKDITFALLDDNNRMYLIKKNRIDEYDIKNLTTLKEIKKFFSKKIYKEDNILITSVKSKLFGLEILGIKKLDEIEKINLKIFQTFIFVIILAILLSKIISYKLSNIVTAPVKRLIKNCKIVSTGNYNIKFEKENNYEVNLLSQVIENMISNIGFLNEKIVEEEKKISEEKLRTLQHQINPHFINNILQTIKSLSLSGENRKISQITTLLGKIMAYSVYQPYESVTIKDELDHIKNYLDIQNIRFNNKIIYSIECEEKFLKIEILKLTLQPILENSIEHGIKGLERGIITIGVEEERDSVCIIINDNGLGIQERKLTEIQENLKNGVVYIKERSIGILNVNERLKRKYGNEFGVDLISRKGAGTTVIIKLPKGIVEV